MGVILLLTYFLFIFFFDFLKSSPKFDFENFPSMLIVYLSILDKGEISFSLKINKLDLLHEEESGMAKYSADPFHFLGRQNILLTSTLSHNGKTFYFRSARFSANLIFYKKEKFTACWKSVISWIITRAEYLAIVHFQLVN